jgi:hypothetical protein
MVKILVLRSILLLESSGGPLPGTRGQKKVTTKLSNRKIALSRTK